MTNVPATAAAIMDALRDAVPDFAAWFEPRMDQYAGRQGLYGQIAELAERLEEAAARDNKEWGEHWDFYLSCDAVADAIARDVDAWDKIDAYLVAL